VALVWPSPVPNPCTKRAAAQELALRQLPQKQTELIALIKEYLRDNSLVAAVTGSSSAVERLLDAFEGEHDNPQFEYSQGITQWEKCEVTEFQEMEYYFLGTNVTVASLFQNFRRGCGIAEFLAQNPTVTAQHVHEVLDHVERSIGF
jgi:hypothetical protein